MNLIVLNEQVKVQKQYWKLQKLNQELVLSPAQCSVTGYVNHKPS